MTLGHTLANQQPGQRALRLVSPPQEENLQPTSPVTPSTASPALRRLQRDLEAAKAEARSLHELLEELPAILEHKFHLRLRGVLAEQRQLEHHNALLQHHLLALRSDGQAGMVQPPALPAAAESPGLRAAEAADSEDSPITQGLGLRRALRHLHR
jgi:hypothetical protein